MPAFSVIILLAVLVFPFGCASVSSPIDTPATDLQTLHTQAAQGNAKAQTNLGFLYANGQGVRQDYVQARQWWEKAAAQGRAKAQTNLGALYANGQGVPRDYVQSYMWWSLAAGRSTGKDQNLAAEYRDRVTSLMTPEQIEEANRLAQKCQAQQFKGC
jgi:uncharacterized protein